MHHYFYFSWSILYKKKKKKYPNFLFLLINQRNVLERKRSGLTSSQFFKKDHCRTNKSRKQKKIILTREENFIFTQIGKCLCNSVLLLVLLYIEYYENFHLKHCSFDIVSQLKIKSRGETLMRFWKCILHYSVSLQLFSPWRCSDKTLWEKVHKDTWKRPFVVLPWLVNQDDTASGLILGSTTTFQHEGNVDVKDQSSVL